MEPKKILGSFFLIAFYSLPYGFFGLVADLRFSSLVGYILGLVGLCILSFLSLALKKPQLVFLGNILSAIFSYRELRRYDPGELAAYFKPFSPLGILIFLSLIFIVIQLLVLYILRKKTSF